MKNKMVLIISLLASIGIILVVFNQTKYLAELNELPDIELTYAAHVTSTVHYTQEEHYIYSLSDVEFFLLLQILSAQEVTRSWFNNDLSPEYFLTLETSMRHYNLEISDDLLFIADTNKYYRLKTDELYALLSILNN